MDESLPATPRRRYPGGGGVAVKLSRLVSDTPPHISTHPGFIKLFAI